MVLNPKSQRCYAEDGFISDLRLKEGQVTVASESGNDTCNVVQIQPSVGLNNIIG